MVAWVGMDIMAQELNLIQVFEIKDLSMHFNEMLKIYNYVLASYYKILSDKY